MFLISLSRLTTLEKAAVQRTPALRKASLNNTEPEELKLDVSIVAAPAQERNGVW